MSHRFIDHSFHSCNIKSISSNQQSMSTTTYKNFSEADHTLVGFGVVRVGDAVETEQ